MRRLKINKNVLGEEYSFFITIHPNTYECLYALHFKSGPTFGATVTEDFGHIILNSPIELDGYINGLNPPKKVIHRIKIPKDQKYKFIEEITGSLGTVADKIIKGDYVVNPEFSDLFLTKKETAKMLVRKVTELFHLQETKDWEDKAINEILKYIK